VRLPALLRVILLALPLAVSFLLPGTAAAHAELRAATPAPGSVLGRSPDEIRLTFSEPLRAASTFVVFNRAFETIPGIEPRLVVGKEEQLASSVPQLEAGIYTVQWNVAGLDGHPTSGSYSFEVTGSDASVGWQWIPGLVIVLALAIGATLLFLGWRQLRQ
jgi:methionine-rich copper-binding protein CopC